MGHYFLDRLDDGKYKRTLIDTYKPKNIWRLLISYLARGFEGVWGNILVFDLLDKLPYSHDLMLLVEDQGPIHVELPRHQELGRRWLVQLKYS